MIDCVVLQWGLLSKTEKKDNKYVHAFILLSHTSTECCELQVATCRDAHTKHSSDCDSVVTKFLKIRELYRHNCACGSYW